MMSLSASELKKGSLFRKHQLDVQNALKCFGITSEVEHNIPRDSWGCRLHERMNFDSITAATDHVLGRHPNANYVGGPLYQKSYSLDNYIESLQLDIESDGQIHASKGRRARDEKRDAYLESLGITVLRFTTKQDPVMIAKAVSLISEARKK